MNNAAITLKDAFRNVDDKDWEYLFLHLLNNGSGHGQFWSAVMREARSALASQPTEGVRAIELPKPTQDQIEYLASIATAGSYDPNTVIGGPERESLLNRIVSAQTASCTCETKTPKLKFHDATCRYRVLGDCAAVVAAPATEPEIDDAAVERLTKFTKWMAAQPTLQELSDDGEEDGDFEAAYETFIQEARRVTVAFRKA